MIWHKIGEQTPGQKDLLLVKTSEGGFFMARRGRLKAEFRAIGPRELATGEFCATFWLKDVTHWAQITEPVTT